MRRAQESRRPTLNDDIDEADIVHTWLSHRADGDIRCHDTLLSRSRFAMQSIDLETAIIATSPCVSFKRTRSECAIRSRMGSVASIVCSASISQLFSLNSHRCAVYSKLRNRRIVSGEGTMMATESSARLRSSNTIAMKGLLLSGISCFLHTSSIDGHRCDRTTTDFSDGNRNWLSTFTDYEFDRWQMFSRGLQLLGVLCNAFEAEG